MARRSIDDGYEYPPWAETIMPHRVVRAAVRRTDLESFELDILQDVLIRLWRAREKGKQLNRQFGYTVLRSVISDARSEAKKHPESVDNHQGNDAVEGDEQKQREPVQEAIDAETRELVTRRLLQLKPIDHMILEFKYHDDYTFKRIAKVVGYSQRGVKGRYAESMKRLRAWARGIQE